MHRCLHFMSAEFREGRPSAAPQRKYYEKILGEDMEWQTADAVREEFDDDEAELRLAEESRIESAMQDGEELLSMEEPWAADDGFTDTTLDNTNTEGHGTTLPWLQRSHEHSHNNQNSTQLPKHKST